MLIQSEVLCQDEMTQPQVYDSWAVPDLTREGSSGSELLSILNSFFFWSHHQSALLPPAAHEAHEKRETLPLLKQPGHQYV